MSLRVVTVLAIVMMTILMMAVLTMLIIVVAMTSSLSVLVYDKADFRRLALVPFSMIAPPALRLRREHKSNTA